VKNRVTVRHAHKRMSQPRGKRTAKSHNVKPKATQKTKGEEGGVGRGDVPLVKQTNPGTRIKTQSFHQPHGRV